MERRKEGEAYIEWSADPSKRRELLKQMEKEMISQLKEGVGNRVYISDSSVMPKVPLGIQTPTVIPFILHIILHYSYLNEIT